MRRRSTVSGLVTGLAGSLVAAAAVQAATPSAYEALDRQSAAACARAADLREPSVGPVTRFSDAAGVDVRMVSGVYPQPHMKGARGTMLCLYDRRTRRAEAQEPPRGFLTTSVQPTEPGKQTAVAIKDVTWVAEDIAGGGIVDNSRVTLMLGSDGRLSGRSGCNQYSARYLLEGEDLRITPPLIGTRIACAPALMNQEGRFQDILGRARSITVLEPGFLIVTAADRRTLRFTREAPSGPDAGSVAFQTLRCGGEQFRVSFRPERAVLETPGGGRVELGNINASHPEQPRRYTNGRVTFEQTLEGPDAGVRFARERAAFVACHVAQD